jgi:hypothetical protein
MRANAWSSQDRDRSVGKFRVRDRSLVAGGNLRPSSSMKIRIISGLGILMLLAVTPALAQPRHGHESGRAMGTFARPHTNAPIQQRSWHNQRTGRDERHAIIYDHRERGAIVRDRFARNWHRGYRAERGWRHFYPIGGWFSVWGIHNWGVVSDVTCEAADEQTGELYPVTANGFGGWSDANVDSVLAQALDECAANAGPGRCVPVQPACSYH